MLLIAPGMTKETRGTFVPVTSACRRRLRSTMFCCLGVAAGFGKLLSGKWSGVTCSGEPAAWLARQHVRRRRGARGVHHCIRGPADGRKGVLEEAGHSRVRLGDDRRGN